MPVTIKGMDELFRELDTLKANIPKSLAVAGQYAMQKNVEDPAKTLCPVDSGELRASIHTVAEVTGQGALIQTGTNVFYGPYVEFGTGIYATKGGGRTTPWRYPYFGRKGSAGWRTTQGIRPQPFLTPAMETNANKIPDSIAQSLRTQIRSLQKAGGK